MGNPMRSTERRRCVGGFAYLWVLLAVALLGLGLVAGAEVEATLIRRDKELELLFDGRQFRAALASYYAAQEGGPHQYPLSLEELLRDPRDGMKARHHLRRVFVDPMTGAAEWGLVRQDGRIVGVYSLSKQAPVKEQGFEGEELGFNGARRYSDWVFTPGGRPAQP